MPVEVHFQLQNRQSRRATPKRLIRTSDGDPPVIEQPIRMVSVDTPEKAGYAGGPPVSEPIATARKAGEDPQRFYTQAELDAAARDLDGYEISRTSAAEMIASAFQRHCVDLRTLEVVGLYDFGEVPPPYRLWIWDDQLEEAKGDLGLN